MNLLAPLLALMAAEASALGDWTANGFRYLRVAASNHYSGRDLMEKDPDLSSWRAEPQWAEILDQVGAEAKSRP